MDMTVVKEDLYVAGRWVAPSDLLGWDLSGGVRLSKRLTIPRHARAASHRAGVS
jgi:hypothetical protein